MGYQGSTAFFDTIQDLWDFQNSNIPACRWSQQSQHKAGPESDSPVHPVYGAVGQQSEREQNLVREAMITSGEAAGAFSWTEHVSLTVKAWKHL